MVNKTQMIERIREKLGDDELLCQLAEECAELAQAALKVKRAMTAKNYTPVGLSEARAKLLEECADVLLCMDAIEFIQKNDYEIAKVMDEKLERWVERIENPNIPPCGSTAWWVCKNGLHGWHICMVRVGERYRNSAGDKFVYLDCDMHTTNGVRVSDFGTYIFKEKVDAENALKKIKRRIKLRKER